MLTAQTIIDWIEEWYPPATAASWDKNGLITGSRGTEVTEVLLAVDPVRETAEEAIELGAQMMITHHPLYLRGTSFVSEDDYKGRLVTELIRNDIALFNAHTNADVAHEGVASALAALVGVEDCEPMEPSDEGIGFGRIGLLPEPMTLADFANQVAGALPKGPTGLLVGGDPQRTVQTVAVSGGAGDSFLDLANQLGADVYLTADLRHHPASEHLEENQAALLCGSHWATEWPWLPVLAKRLMGRAAQAGANLEVVVSTTCTEPWSAHLATKGEY